MNEKENTGAYYNVKMIEGENNKLFSADVGELKGKTRKEFIDITTIALAFFIANWQDKNALMQWYGWVGSMTEDIFQVHLSEAIKAFKKSDMKVVVWRIVRPKK